MGACPVSDKMSLSVCTPSRNLARLTSPRLHRGRHVRNQTARILATPL